MAQPLLYALDFDGVICDSAVETAITGWKAASQIWPELPAKPPVLFVEQFRQLRPALETGYEAILAMRLLHEGVAVETVYNQYQELTHALIDEAQLSIDELKRLFGSTRDQWIAADLADWVTMNPLFPGMASFLNQLNQHQAWVVITTKQERFVKQILTANGISLADEHIYGLDRNLSKVEVLRSLLNQQPDLKIRFVEDRLPTLVNVAKQADLQLVDLVFAAWGYNTANDKIDAIGQGFINQNLDEFLNGLN